MYLKIIYLFTIDNFIFIKQDRAERERKTLEVSDYLNIMGIDEIIDHY